MQKVKVTKSPAAIDALFLFMLGYIYDISCTIKRNKIFKNLYKQCIYVCVNILMISLCFNMLTEINIFI